MNEPEKKQIGELLLSIQQFHSQIGIAFPMEVVIIGKGGTKCMPADQEGSRVFITVLFKQIEAVASTIKNMISNLSPSVAKEILQTFLVEMLHLLNQIKMEGRYGNPIKINQAVILLYLVSGLVQHYVASTLEISIPSSERFLQVESIEKLFSLCKADYEYKNMSINHIFNQVIENCRIC